MGRCDVAPLRGHLSNFRHPVSPLILRAIRAPPRPASMTGTGAGHVANPPLEPKVTSGWRVNHESAREYRREGSPLAIRYVVDVNAASKRPRVNAVTSGMTSNCFIEMFRMDVSLVI